VSHEFPADLVDTSPEELATIINVNVTATLRVTSLIAPSMVSRSVPSLSARRWDTHTLTHCFRTFWVPISKKGLIMNMGSFAGAAPTPMLAVYSASKAFVRTWSESLAAELAPKGVLVEHANAYYVVRLLPTCIKE
jgi:17beta-estradiol 17-dehydrogenase / very-long-chain 3-oxoacyl-CoA reductase